MLGSSPLKCCDFLKPYRLRCCTKLKKLVALKLFKDKNPFSSSFLLTMIPSPWWFQTMASTSISLTNRHSFVGKRVALSESSIFCLFRPEEEKIILFLNSQAKFTEFTSRVLFSFLNWPYDFWLVIYQPITNSWQTHFRNNVVYNA